MRSMEIGGAERSLLGLLNAFDYEKYDVTLMLLKHKGDFLKYIPEKITLLPEDRSYAVFEVPIKSLLFSKKIVFGVARILGKIEYYIYKKLNHITQDSPWIKLQYAHKYIVPYNSKIYGAYDLAINFLGIPDILVKKVDARIKATWIHTDYNHIIANKKMDIALYSNLDYIVNVSNDCQKVFLEHYPQFKEKAIVVENILSQRFIEKQAMEFSTEKEMPRLADCINILSIGRFGRAKNFDNIPKITKKILEKGVDVKWYIIGYGGDEELIKNKIEEVDMQEHVIVLGKKENPYPYIKACDVYIQPSRFEGKAVTVREAQILHKPVIITNYETAKSQLRDGVDGIIVPMNNHACANKIANLICNKKILNKMIEGTKKNDYSNHHEVNKLYKLIGHVNE